MAHCFEYVALLSFAPEPQIEKVSLYYSPDQLKNISQQKSFWEKWLTLQWLTLLASKLGGRGLEPPSDI